MHLRKTLHSGAPSFMRSSRSATRVSRPLIVRLSGGGLELVEIPRAALFLAGKVFQRYRAHAGSGTGVLPDFFIGAHAAVAQLPLLTRDPSRYRSYFSGIVLITPDDTGPI
jgi:predicted nucleic acid-binding protein